MRANDIVSMGYNGPPSGEAHCQGDSCAVTELGGCVRSRHAERNAIERAQAKLGDLLTGCAMFSTYGPCFECAQLIYNAGIIAFYYRYSYRAQEEGIKLLLTRGIVYRITPSGIMVNVRTGGIVNAPHD